MVFAPPRTRRSGKLGVSFASGPCPAMLPALLLLACLAFANAVPVKLMTTEATIKSGSELEGTPAAGVAVEGDGFRKLLQAPADLTTEPTTDGLRLGSEISMGTSAGSNLCWDVPYDSKDIGTALWQYRCNQETRAQVLTIQDAGSGYVTIKTSSGLCLAVEGTANMARLTQRTCSSGATSQQFSFHASKATSGRFYIKVRNSASDNKCLDVHNFSGNNETPLILHDCNATGAQRFYIRDASDGKLGCARLYNRGAGKLPDNCGGNPDYPEKDGALCYPRCRDGYNGVGPVCYYDQRCPGDFTDTGLHCLKPNKSYGRGAGKVTRKSCEKGAPQGCDKSGALFYPKCREGFKAFGCCICSPSCPGGTKDIGVSCEKDSYGRTAGIPLGCRSELENDAGLCYPRCRAGYRGVATGCYVRSCPWDKPQKCGVFCVKSGECDTVSEQLGAVAGLQALAAASCSLDTTKDALCDPTAQISQQASADLSAWLDENGLQDTCFP